MQAIKLPNMPDNKTDQVDFTDEFIAWSRRQVSDNIMKAEFAVNVGNKHQCDEAVKICQEQEKIIVDEKTHNEEKVIGEKFYEGMPRYLFRNGTHTRYLEC